jgi:two-component system, chemotaxis family, sensor kinase CheA
VNDFLQQFLIESRELVDQASDGLLILERSPRDTERLDAVFRAFHTLKGGAGIVDFAAMERAVHAAEDVLSGARSGKRPLTPELIGRCLACLDGVVQWLDTLEKTGELPASAARQADGIVRQLEVAVEPAETTGKALNVGATRGWVAEILERNPDARAQAITAVRLIPDPDCLYRAEDPIALVTSLPTLLALDLEPVSAWPVLSGLDPFACNLVLTALTASSADEVGAHLQGHSGECEIVAITAAQVVGKDSPLPQQVRNVLEAQIALINEGKRRSFAGRIASAGLTSANVWRFCGRIDQAETLARATEQSLKNNTPQPLQSAIAQSLAMQSALIPLAPEPVPRVDATPRTLRVDAERIDALVRLTGELTVAKNAIGHVVKLAHAGDPSAAGVLKNRHGVLERLIGELQRSVLQMRVLPLRSVLQRFPRVVREMSTGLGKPIKLQIQGDATEADKAIVEMLFEPLLHVVRNAIDHGVESPTERAARGKPAVATLKIGAARQANQVLIEVADDGGGVDVDRVRAVAKSRGIVTEESLRMMAESAVMDLVFAPGLSTAAKVTGLSGRGVGMDAVRTAVQRVGGRVGIESRAGHGTTVRFALPFSVMMTHVMTVEAGGQMFGIPLDAVVETVRVSEDAMAAVGAARAIVLRNRTIPVLELAGVLGVNHETREDSDTLIVITSVAGQLGGIQVDRLGERMEVILEPLAGLLSGTPGITGTTLLGDGRVLLVLDIGELLR